MKHHPSTIASKHVLRVSRRNGKPHLNSLISDDVTKILAFAECHSASSSPAEWDDTTKMLFRISHPEVTFFSYWVEEDDD